ncbi:hypothetical protein M8994_22335, partial [Brucella sp. 21LCYQ03]|nr:hypothetical protein [Brucella sp. 21LCYQ03]
MKLIIFLSIITLGMQRGLAMEKLTVGKIEKLDVVAHLPKAENHLTAESTGYLELVRLHEEFNIAMIIPVWVTKEPRLVLMASDSSRYYNVSDEQF